MQALVIIIVAIITILIKSSFKFSFLKGIKPIDVLLPFWFLFIYSNTVSTASYSFLPWILIPFVLLLIIILITEFFRTGNVLIRKSLKLIWRIGDISFPLLWIISIFLK
ncbi:DUF3397 family protein [Lactobacillus sp. Sy-1]|nr:DUF3397 family protein [Lactobacillus sp. Sy-1]